MQTLVSRTGEDAPVRRTARDPRPRRNERTRVLEHQQLVRPIPQWQRVNRHRQTRDERLLFAGLQIDQAYTRRTATERKSGKECHQCVSLPAQATDAVRHGLADGGPKGAVFGTFGKCVMVSMRPVNRLTAATEL